MLNQGLSTNKSGTVYWFTGYSGAGKTTIGKLFHDRLIQQGRIAVFLDGDDLRSIFGNDLGYSIEDRKKSAQRNSRLCKFLADHGVDVVCATISVFHSCREWNKENIANYKEIYLKVAHEVRSKRDIKGIYPTKRTEIAENVVGLDIRGEEPETPTVTVENDGRLSPFAVVDFLEGKLFGSVSNGFEGRAQSGKKRQ